MTEKQTINFAYHPAKKSGFLKSLLYICPAIAAVVLIVVFIGLRPLSQTQKAQQTAASDLPIGDTTAALPHDTTYIPLSAYDAALADRSAVLELIRNTLIPVGDILLWSVIDNDITMTMTIPEASDTDILIQKLISDPTVLSAEVTASAETRSGVMVNLSIALAAPEEKSAEIAGMPSESAAALTAIRTALSGADKAASDQVGELREGDRLLREYAVQFYVSDFFGLETAAARLQAGEHPCIIRDIRADSSLGDRILVNMTVCFYELSAADTTEG